MKLNFLAGKALLATLCLVSVPSQAVETTELVARDKLQWRRGNMHTHSHWSDGDDYLESIAKWYREQGYNFLVFTDHNVLSNVEEWRVVSETKGGQRAFDKLQKNFPNWVETREKEGQLEVRLRRFDEVAERFNSPGELLLIPGEEISDSFERLPLHLNVSNVAEKISPQGGVDVYSVIQNNVWAVLEQRKATGQPMIVHLNHPNFGWAVTAEDLMKVQGEQFFEVYNGHPGVNDSGDELRASTERIWDIILANRLSVLRLPVMYGLAVDDGHSYHNIPSRASEPGRGWVMVLTKELTAAAIIDALEHGRFYASSGVTLRRVATNSQSLEVEIEPEEGVDYTIEFVGTRESANLKGEPVVDENGKPVRTTMRYSDEVGQVLATIKGTRGKYEFDGDELYVRARIRSNRLHPNPSEIEDVEMAWTQPVVVGGQSFQSEDSTNANEK